MFAITRDKHSVQYKIYFETFQNNNVTLYFDWRVPTKYCNMIGRVNWLFAFLILNCKASKLDFMTEFITVPLDMINLF